MKTHLVVRAATEADVPTLLEMGRRFIETSVYREHMAVVPRRQAEVVATMLRQGGCWVLVPADGGSPVGMLGVVLAPLPMTGELAALEAMWWVEPEWRGRGSLAMWRTAEQWAYAQGAVWVQMLQPVDQVALGAVYRRRGYAPIEVAWMKRIA